MLKFFKIWMHLLALLIVVQFFLAGYGAIGSGSPDESFSLHIMNGRLIGAVSLLAIVFAALARAGGKLVGLAAGVFGLVALQSVIALVSVAGTVPGQVIFGFHALNALVIMFMAHKTDSHASAIADERKAAGAPEPVAA